MTQEETGAANVQTNVEESSNGFSSPAAMAHDIGDLILDKKGQELTVINVEKVTTIADYLVLTTAHSSRQVSAIAKEISEFVKSCGGNVYSSEGINEGWWVLMDLGDVIVHVMQDDARRYYDLEMLWSDGRVVRQAAMAENDDDLDGESGEDDDQQDLAS